MNVPQIYKNRNECSKLKILLPGDWRHGCKIDLLEKFFLEEPLLDKFSCLPDQVGMRVIQVLTRIGKVFLCHPFFKIKTGRLAGQALVQFLHQCIPWRIAIACGSGKLIEEFSAIV